MINEKRKSKVQIINDLDDEDEEPIDEPVVFEDVTIKADEMDSSLEAEVSSIIKSNLEKVKSIEVLYNQ
jgi:hypothetical protein